MLQIKKVQKHDLNIIQDILMNHIDESDKKDSSSNTNHIEKLLEDDRCYLLAALMDDAVVGYALAYRFPSLYAPENLAYLYDISVSEEHRRKGIGTLLIQSLKEYLKADNVKELWLGTGTNNKEGQGLYNATGAIKSDETFNDYTYYL